MVGVAVLLQATGSGACAAVVDAVPGAVPGTGQQSGTATYYTLAGLSNCGFTAPADGLYVALSPSEYAAAGACGGYLDVTGRTGTVRVKIIDQCPECATGHIDLSRQAFAKIDDPVKGQVPVTYHLVSDPPLSAALTFTVKSGSSQYWLAILVDNTGNPLSSVAVQSGGGWTALSRQDYNYWLASAGAGGGPFTVRVTDVAGHQAVVSGIRLSPGAVQSTTVRLYAGSGTGAVTGATAPRAAAGTSPPASASASVGTSPAGSSSAEPAATIGNVAAPMLAAPSTRANCH